MDRRDFLKLFALSAAGLYIPKVTYFDMGRSLRQFTGIDYGSGDYSTLTKASYRGKEFWFEPLTIDDGFIIPPEVEPALLKFIEEQKSVIVGQFALPKALVGEVGSKTYLEELRRVEESRGIK